MPNVSATSARPANGTLASAVSVWPLIFDFTSCDTSARVLPIRSDPGATKA